MRVIWLPHREGRIMELQLAKYRKRAGYKSRDDFAEVLGVNKYTYRAWESGKAMMSLEQAYNCAVALRCSIDEIAGREPASLPADERALLSDYRSLTPREKALVCETASTMADGGNAKNLGDVGAEAV